MKIAVIGHLCLDVIHQPDNKEIQSYGGIFFSVATLANLLNSNDEIYPIFGVGVNEYDDFINRLSNYKNVDTSGIYKFNGPTNRVNLYYKDFENRIECSENISEPILWKKIKQYLDVDIILINMISGFDITLETLDEIRMVVRENDIPIYMDIHSLTLGIKEDCTRYRRPVENWRRWLFMLHGVQMNEEEASNLTIEKFDDTSLASHILSLNTKHLIITKGERGCTLFSGKHKQVQHAEIDVPNLQQAADTTGCGDVFAASYCAKYIKTKDVFASASFANEVASYKALLYGSDGIDKLAKFRIQEKQ